MESNTPKLPEPTPASVESSAAAVPATRRGGFLTGLMALIAIVAAGYATWRTETSLRTASTSRSDVLAQLEQRIDQASHDDGQLRKDVDALRARWRDADTVNKGLREEMLSLAERSRHLDDAIANLAEQRLSGRDALALNEAEFLLLMAQERYALFADADAAITACQLADSALAVSEDPVFASVRQTIAAEIKALQSVQAASAQPTLTAIGALRDAAASWPLRTQGAVDDANTSRFSRVFARFIQIRHDDDALATRDPTMARSLMSVDLQAATAALLARDEAAWRAALARARAGIVASYDEASEPVRTALAQLDQLASLAIAAPVPVLGTALKELRDLRANRALSRQPPAAEPVPTAEPPAAAPADAATPPEATP